MEEILDLIRQKIASLEAEKAAYEHSSEDAQVAELEQQLNDAIAARNEKAAKEAAIEKEIGVWTEIQSKLETLEG